jgi:peroxiredoxin
MKNISTLILLLVSFTLAGQQIEDISLPNVVDGKNISIKDYASGVGVVVIFTMNSCPFDEYYAGRISNLTKGKVPVLLVNASPDPNESVENMLKCSTQRGLAIPYLADKDQKLMQSLGAHKSTEAFLLKNTNGKLSVYYHGAIDDNPQVAADVKHAYLQEAITKMMAGQASDQTEIRPVGCNIRKK